MRGHYLQGQQQTLDAMDRLHRIVRYLAQQFRMDMTRDQAKANLDARMVIMRRQNQFLVEVGLPPVTHEEVVAGSKTGAALITDSCELRTGA